MRPHWRTLFFVPINTGPINPMFRTLHFLTLPLVLLTLGCSNPADSKIRELNATSIQRLANTYTFYQARNSYKGPKDEEALREFIASPQNQKGFERAGIDVSDVDALFISPRDEEPFKIKYGMAGSTLGFKDAIIFESVGVEDEIMVGFGGGRTELMSPDEADELFKSKKKKKENVTRNDSPEDQE